MPKIYLVVVDRPILVVKNAKIALQWYLQGYLTRWINDFNDCVLLSMGALVKKVPKTYTIVLW